VNRTSDIEIKKKPTYKVGFFYELSIR